ncbi:MAG: hypothetical protein HWD58_10890 [Bacteroidota bacterium]|nr:MAG: hypothetical protein HWD58_10890 [Bacteroidota bacterium]
MRRRIAFTWNGLIFTEAGTQTAVLINAANCDSLATLHLSTQNCGGSLQLFSYLQGYYSGAYTMQPVLMNSGVYNSYADCDTVWVEWHDTLAPYTLLYALPATLQTNGSISVNLPVALLNNWYYLALRNRNHIQTWSAQPIQMQALTAYDFSTGAEKVMV